MKMKFYRQSSKKFEPKTWQSYLQEAFRKLLKKRLIEWRKQATVVRIEKPTNLARAHTLGYKAKQGYAVARVRVEKGRRKRKKPRKGRKPSKYGRFFTLEKSKQRVAEEKASRRFKNMEVLNSYFVGEDGIHKWFEVILVDVSHPVIKSDKKINWIIGHRGRAERGLTAAGRRSRALQR
ncbi:MAG: 50S ribosomal protein L15e [Candidatus Aenigmatarchaeota archaeon]